MVWEENGKKLEENTCFKDSLQYRSIGLILIMSGLETISVRDNPIFKRGCFKEILRVNLNQKYPASTVPIGK